MIHRKTILNSINPMRTAYAIFVFLATLILYTVMRSANYHATFNADLFARLTFIAFLPTMLLAFIFTTIWLVRNLLVLNKREREAACLHCGYPRLDREGPCTECGLSSGGPSRLSRLDVRKFALLLALPYLAACVLGETICVLEERAAASAARTYFSATPAPTTPFRSPRFCSGYEMVIFADGSATIMD